MTSSKLITALLLSCAAATHAAAQQPKADAVSAAQRFLVASGSTDAMIAAMRANLPMQRSANPQIPAEFWNRFEVRIVRDAHQLVDSIAVLYAAKFTLSELDGLTAFYRSPVGRRLRTLQPELIAESAAIGQRWGTRIGEEIGASMQPK
ncbi:MAG: DUF2059 domain-containing protein [Gemmatimonadales bacterium]